MDEDKKKSSKTTTNQGRNQSEKGKEYNIRSEKIRYKNADDIYE
ncbi:hypothetical protein [Ornithinibacillus caprae]|nr:hypothetical protein [Ornithinibacillus caprae]